VVAGEAIFTDSSGDWNGAFVWTESDGFVGLGYLADSATPAVIATRPRTMASAISADGSAIVGSSVRSDGNYEAFRWSDGAIEGLGVLASATHPTSIATAVSADGKVVVGDAVNDEGSGDFVDAFRWSEAGGIQSLGEWLGPSVDLSTVTSRQASAVSADGNTIGGTMVRDGYTQAFIARVGGIIAPEDAAASFAATSSTTTDADRSVADDATAGRKCRAFGANGLCLFGRLEAGLNNGTDHPVSGTFGAAARFGVRSRAGLAVGNLDRAFDLEFDGHVHEVGPIVSAYAGWGMDDETGPQLFAAASSGWLDAETQRGYVNGSATAVSTGRANIGAAVLTSRAAFGFRVAPALIASPWAGLSQSWTHEAAYAEGGGPFPAAFSERGTDTLISRLGFDARVSIGAGCRLTASAAWAHTLVSHADPISGSMDGLDISVPGALPASDWGEASIGVDLNASAHARISTGISGAFGGGMDRLALNVGFQDGF
jgi:probable HAF family extracellular repeat protein